MLAPLTDTLDNGAGFCTRLADPEEFGRLLERTQSMLDDFGRGTHGRECRGSCYECLRDYTNMAYHTLLDWRLAGELLGVLLGKALDTGAVLTRGGRFLAEWAKDPVLDRVEFYDDLRGTGPAVLLDERLWVAPKHPFEAADGQLAGPRIKDVRQAAGAERPGVPHVVFIDDFLLDRVPGRVTAELGDFDPK